MAPTESPKEGREVTPLPRTSRLDNPVAVSRGERSLHPVADLFHALMTASWPKTIVIVFVGYFLANIPFALLYMALGDSIQNARPGSFEDAYFFSIQTMATIGYGSMSPRGTLADFVVSVEAISGIVATAVVTGVIFAKFSRPTARLLFSHTALVGKMDGRRVLMLRLANERDSRIMGPTASLVLLRDEVTSEGQRFRRIHDLKLQRERSVVFALTWTIFHTIDENSPLFGETQESLLAKNAGLIVSLSGTDETLMQSVHARHAYDAESLVFGARFVDILVPSPEGRILELGRLHTYLLDDSVDEATSA